MEGANGVWSATSKSQECLQNDVYAGDQANPMGDFDQALAAALCPPST